MELVLAGNPFDRPYPKLILSANLKRERIVPAKSLIENGGVFALSMRMLVAKTQYYGRFLGGASTELHTRKWVGNWHWVCVTPRWHQLQLLVYGA
jgi:hypothetical protein